MKQKSKVSIPKASPKLKELGKQIQRDYKDAHLTFEEFPSGSASLDVKIYDSFFILEYRKEHGYGLSCVPIGDRGWDLGYDEVFSRFTVARMRLLTHIRKAVEQHEANLKKKRLVRPVLPRFPGSAGLLNRAVKHLRAKQPSGRHKLLSTDISGQNSTT